MSLFRELEDKIMQHGLVQPFPVILAEVLRTQDYPMDAQLYLNIVAAYTDFYERMKTEKAYIKELQEETSEDNESETE